MKIRIATMLLLILSMYGCCQKQLSYPLDMRVLNIRFEWTVPPVTKPEGMTLCFYSRDNEDVDRVWRFQIAGCDGGPVELPYGHYLLLVYNNDATNIYFGQTESILTASARVATDGDVCTPVGELYRAVVTEIDFNSAGMTYIAYPQKITTTYHVEVRNVIGAERIIKSQMTLNNVSGGLWLESGLPCDGPFSVAADMIIKEHELATAFEFFRPYRPLEGRCILTLSVALTTRRIYTINIDVSDQIANNTNPLDVTIILDHLEIPEDGSVDDPDVGITAGVDGWHEVNIDYVTDLDDLMHKANRYSDK